MAIEFRLTGGVGNSNPALSLGGATSSYQLASQALGNLFGNVNIGDSNAKYRAVSLKCAAAAHASLLFWVPANTVSAGTQLSAWFEGKNLGTPQQVADEETAPSGADFKDYDGLILREAAAQGATSNTLTLDAACALTAAQLVGYVLEMVSGRSRDQRRRITNYDAGTKVATLDAAWVTQPTSGNKFRIERKYLLSDAALNDDFRWWLRRTQEATMGESLYDAATLAGQWWK